MRRLLSIATACLAATTAHPWGPQGHAAVGLVAEQRLTEPTRAEIRRILGNDDLASIASWMDQVLGVEKGFGPLAGSAEAHAFVARFPHSNVWHYVDLPQGESKYSDDDPFSRPDDVVHELNLAIRSLEGTSHDVPPKIALYMVVHFVGDLHQPLHVACGFYDLADPAHPVLITDPKQAAGKTSDAGGNLLRFGERSWDELHAYWDTDLPRKFAGSRDPAVLAQKMAALIRPGDWATPGDHHTWAEQWATESIIAARRAYAGLAFGPAEIEDGKLRRIAVTLPPGYDAAVLPVVQERLAKAGFHLAELLNAIDWPDKK